jgi:hypothetical protein
MAKTFWPLACASAFDDSQFGFSPAQDNGQAWPHFAGVAVVSLNQWGLLTEEWWRQATRGVPGTEPHHAQVVSFAVRQWLDTTSPSNQAWSNVAAQRIGALVCPGLRGIHNAAPGFGGLDDQAVCLQPPPFCAPPVSWHAHWL